MVCYRPIAKKTTSPTVVVDERKCSASALPFLPHESEKSDKAVYSFPVASETTTINGSARNEIGYDASA